MSVGFGNVTRVYGFDHAIFKDIIKIEKSQKRMAVMMEKLLRLSQKLKN